MLLGSAVLTSSDSIPSAAAASCASATISTAFVTVAAAATTSDSAGAGATTESSAPAADDDAATAAADLACTAGAHEESVKPSFGWPSSCMRPSNLDCSSRFWASSTPMREAAAVTTLSAVAEAAMRGGGGSGGPGGGSGGPWDPPELPQGPPPLLPPLPPRSEDALGPHVRRSESLQDDVDKQRSRPVAWGAEATTPEPLPPCLSPLAAAGATTAPS
mmetsp:Transcript_95084/g.204144  ORF Transcript_95084/g.204144 Transcript_95084/m.204144 type:complete len:218 (+) Transcript_95084:101-754(+)